jgi:hypothetical protein
MKNDFPAAPASTATPPPLTPRKGKGNGAVRGSRTAAALRTAVPPASDSIPMSNVFPILFSAVTQFSTLTACAPDAAHR